MSDHLSDDLIGRYRQLLPLELLAIDDHVSKCESCRNRLLHAHQTPYTSSYVKNDFLTAPIFHLSYHQLESYVDQIDDFTDQEIVESHISICELCNELVKDLQDVARQTKIEQDWKDKILFLWRSPEYSAPFRTVAYAAILMFFGLVLSLLMRPQTNLQTELRNKQLEHQLAELQKNSQQQIEWTDVETFPEPYQKIATATLADERVAIPSFVQELKGKQKVLLGNQKTFFHVQSPVGTAVETTQPEFYWTAIPDATYVVNIYDTQYNAIAFSPALKKATWKISEPLARGKTYVWKVTATTKNREISAPVPPAPEAKFTVLAENQLKDINTLREQYPNSQLLLGLVYANFGLMNESFEEFNKLREENPDSKLAQKLLDSLQAYNQKQ